MTEEITQSLPKEAYVFTETDLVKIFARTILFLLQDGHGISIRNEKNGKNYVVFRLNGVISVTEDAQDITEGLHVKIENK